MALKGMGGFGNMGGMGNLMQQLQQTQKKIREDAEKMQERLNAARLEGTAGGAIKVIVDGNGMIQELKIAKEAVDPDDVASLEEMITTALRQALEKAEELRSDEQQKLMPAGFNLPGLF